MPSSTPSPLPRGASRSVRDQSASFTVRRRRRHVARITCRRGPRAGRAGRGGRPAFVRRPPPHGPACCLPVTGRVLRSPPGAGRGSAPVMAAATLLMSGAAPRRVAQREPCRSPSRRGAACVDSCSCLRAVWGCPAPRADSAQSGERPLCHTLGGVPCHASGALPRVPGAVPHAGCSATHWVPCHTPNALPHALGAPMTCERAQVDVSSCRRGETESRGTAREKREREREREREGGKEGGREGGREGEGERREG